MHDRLMMARFEKAYDAYMQELRESMGKASKRGQRSIPGYA